MAIKTNNSELDLTVDLMNLATLADIHRERGDEAAAVEAELERYALLKAIAAGVQ